MSSEVKIKAESRTTFGKGAARRIRRDDKVPAVLYGHGTDPVHITLPGHDLMLALKTANALLSIEIDGESQLALPKQVQRDPIKGFIEHADLILVRRGEKVTVDVRIVLVGDPAPETLITLDHQTVQVEAEATHIPETIEVDVEGLAVGTQILAKNLTLPEGTTLVLDDEALVVNFSAAPTAEEVEAELAEAEADAGIEHDLSADELEAQAAEGAASESGDGEATSPESGEGASNESGDGESAPQE
ncbi:MAG: 50S ribosomal protein L25/general stress protein Ctc [Propionibacteriales bacterium]|nr:50S ribosomal protein L25/general stress protein Ctc [Propionibacteriales bacterium]